VKAFFKRIAEETGKPYNEQDLRPLLDEIGFAASMIGATLQNTANPTMLEAGYKANVIPGSASAVVDGRFIPGFEDELNETIKSLIGEHVSVETITRDKALEVPFEGDLVEAMCNALIKEDSVAIPVPYVMSGGTDNKALADLGIIGYGFSPLKLDADFNFMAMFHGVDERVPVEGLAFGARVLKDFLENA
jgi:acetylornithine deacetylase/succinyl-diaminopimelate desuccinylase-like protein